MIWLYLANTLLVCAIVLAVLFPSATRRLLIHLGLWSRLQTIDTRRFALAVERLGIFLMVAALALFASILSGSHPADWSLPAAEGLFFGVALFLAGYWSRPPSP
ncbi:hypothetical protein [Acidithiobacillus caldus]|jgi:signal transduction histidine kinase|uniref:Uncharacterized protein n=2 Tax=Acidithiobacillus caldus TaxID=33059 RepID=A0A059ZXY8_ACICK|nr:hypothetical protein [Acidithiobacillus caldus]AIA56400.1 hypothetical protein Acaty_c2556 [Acidithiobacillus caldus ATCC 51756]MBU2730549.1 hypothetical protein [Acidithiobacillus caldus]MBU2734980.1 hypothetical protein [Acidithiobacillus caldus ATCC 51756]MBU2744388.1 hypothetical protein [Acidithiobacillus caldus]MBU2781032.1 hypothetical protein [Acidithiobacillus caldus]